MDSVGDWVLCGADPKNPSGLLGYVQRDTGFSFWLRPLFTNSVTRCTQYAQVGLLTLRKQICAVQIDSSRPTTKVKLPV